MIQAGRVRDISLRTRLMAAMVALVAATALAVAVLSSLNLREVMLGQISTQLKAESRLLAAGLTSYVGNTVADLKVARGQPAAAALLRAVRHDGRDPETGLVSRYLHNQLAEWFEGDLKVTPRYLQMRLIAGGETGRELVRVDRSGPGGAIRVVPPKELQSKIDRDYFHAAMSLAPGGLYISAIDLNQEHGAIEVPHVPVLRFANAIHGKDGKALGFVIINVAMAPALDVLRRGVNIGDRVYVIDEKGGFLVHPDRQKEFGAQLERSWNFKDEFPEKENAPETESDILADADGVEYVAARASGKVAGGPSVTVLDAVRLDKATTPAALAQRSSLIAGGVVSFGAIGLAVVMARRLARPLTQLTAAVEDIAADRPRALPEDDGSEIGTLTRAFARYVERERLYSAAFQSTDDAALTTDLDGIITGWNQAAERLYGYSAAEAIGRSLAIIIPESRKGELQMSLAKARTGESIRYFKTVRQAKDGSLINVSLTISPFCASSGEVIGVSVIARDTAQERRIEEKFHLAVEACPVGMIITDADGEIELINSVVEQMFGYERTELLGRKVDMLVPRRYQAGHPQHRRDFTAAPESRPMGAGRDLYALRKDGTEFPVEVSLSPAETAEGLIIICVVADITRRVAAAAAIEAKTRELERSNADLEQFAYVASHDLREPLRMVASYTELLAERYQGKLDEKADKYINYATEGARRMQGMVSDLLAYSRVSKAGMSPKPVNTEAVVQKILVLLRMSVEESGAEIICGELPEITADEAQFSQLMQNLVANALKFRAERPPRIRIGAERKNGAWVFSVEDNGIGIEMGHAERIFQMFQRLHPRGKYEGSGIGLAISKKIAERHGGKLWFHSTPGEGSVFHFSIPVGPKGEMA